MQSVIVESILWQGRRGGAIFNASTTAGTAYRIIADGQVMPRPPVVGETWDIDGIVRRHVVHGSQVEARKASLRKPSGRLIVRTIAFSKAFPGIGKSRARALWEKFGEDIYQLLSLGASEPFEEVLGPELARVLVRGWEGLETEASVYQWLDMHGLPVWLANKLLAIYGGETVAKLEENAYRILAFTSWSHAEQVAQSMGLAADDDRRLIAAADAACYQRLAFGHSWSSWDGFIGHLGKLLRLGQDAAIKAANQAEQAFAVARVGAGIQGVGPFSMEKFVASRVKAMLSGRFEAEQLTLRQSATLDNLADIYANFKDRTGLDLNDRQKEAVRLAVSAPFCCIKGGAGVGKTTTLRAIHTASETLAFGGVIQMALSGRAAKRMTEATGRRAYTIAGFLQGVDNGNIKLDGEYVLIVDESSMLDLTHCYRIMRRMTPGTKLLLVGDDAQLPPIGFGLTFHCLASHALVPAIELTEIHRQAAATGIPQASLAVRNGHVPDLTGYSGLTDGVSFIDATAEEVSDTIMDVVNDLGGVNSCQIISAVKNGPAGVRTINSQFHQLLTVGQPLSCGYAVNEPVIWTTNDYQRNLFNGSLGVVTATQKHLTVNFDGVEHALDETDAYEMEHAYAITVHKAQGSQFERVIVPVFPSRLLDRTLLYTAITRAEKQVVLVGDRSAFEKAVRELPSYSKRETAMIEHLRM